MIKTDKIQYTVLFYLVTCLLTGLIIVFQANCAESPDAIEPQPFRVAFTSSMFTDVNVDDARAAMKIWIMTVAKEWGIPADCNPYIYKTIDGLMKFSRENDVDGFGLITSEYERLSQEMQFDQIVVSTQGGHIKKEYLLLVRNDAGIDRLEQLKDRSVNVLNNPHMSLAVTWLDTLLMERDLNRAVDFFGKMTLNNKPAQVLLPVFFGKVDACLVTRNVFTVMGELNPQLHAQLKVIKASPGFIASCFIFRSDYISSYRAKVMNAMDRLKDSPAGRQILLLTKADSIEARSLDCLNDSLKLLARHRQLCRERNVGFQDLLPGASDMSQEQSNYP